MGTRSITHVRNNEQTIIVTIYRQYDGYPTGMGQDIKDILGKRRLVNGYTDTRTQINGAGCGAALLVAQLKGVEAGNVYIEEPGTSGMDEEYTYWVDFVDTGEDDYIHITVDAGPDEVFSGRLDKFDPKELERSLTNLPG